MERSPYQVGIDLGTTYTAAAVCRDGEARPETVPLATASAAVASVVFLAPDGALLVGEPAQRRALSEPRRVVREFKRRIGDDTPLVVGGTSIPADTVSARFVAWVVDEVARREGGPASAITVTHPVEWGEHKRRSFAAALAAEGLSDVAFLTEPQAAAIGYASAARIVPGRAVAVYDLGGGTFDAAVVQGAPDGSYLLCGRPTGIERLGGVDFDEAIFAHVRAAIGDAWDGLDPDDPAVHTAVAGLRRECTAAKETLSADTEAMIPVQLPGLHMMVRLGRTEFEDMIRPAVVETVEALRRALDLAQTSPDELEAVLLVGGSSRIPLVSQMVSAELGRAVSVDSDPKAVVAAGAAVSARGRLAPEPETALVPVVDDALGDAAPTSPSMAIAAPSMLPTVAPKRRRQSVLLASAVVGVGAVVALSASTVAGLGPFAARPVAEQSAAVPAAETAAVDPWTGTSIYAENAAEGGTDTTDGETTLAGPRRADAVAARVRPVARNVPTGAGGAARAIPVRQVNGTVVTQQQPPVVRSETTRIPGTSVTANNGETKTSNSNQNTGTSGTGGTTGGTTSGGTTSGGTSGGTTGGTTSGGTTGGTTTGETTGGTTSGGTSGGTTTGETTTGGTTGGTTSGGETTGGTTSGGTTGGTTSGGETTTGGTTGGGETTTGGTTSGDTTGGGDSGAASNPTPAS